MTGTIPYLLFEFPDEKGNAEPLCFTDPVEVVTAGRIEEVIPALKKVQKAGDEGLYAAGYVSYEAAPAFDRTLFTHHKTKMPLLWFGLFTRPRKVILPEKQETFRLSAWRSDTDFCSYQAHFSDIQEAIRKGETYQVNYSFRLHSEFAGDDFAFYRRLSANQRSKYSVYLNIGPFRVLSASPELFFRRDGDRIVTRPMKGTASRGRWTEEDLANASRLHHSAKDRAENIMIVDLLRNDLSIIARAGSVRTSHLFEIEHYPTLLQMTSAIEAETKPGTTLEDIFRALFPCGSVTGAPKVSTMKWIVNLENTPREVYCGAVGFIDPDGRAIFNVAIRTVIIDTHSGMAEYGTGGGITADSAADEEYREALMKAKLLTENTPRFRLLESLKLENGKYYLLERHLRRLKESAGYFHFQISTEKIKAKLEAYAGKRSDGLYKVRLLVSPKGKITVEGQPIQPLRGPLPVAVSEKPVDGKNPFLCHKTTQRKVYERCRSARPDVFDVLLWNEKGELTEFTNGNLVLELNGQYLTPPRECGLLNGTFREELLAGGTIREQVLTLKDLESCSRFWLINSVRGWVPVYTAGEQEF